MRKISLKEIDDTIQANRKETNSTIRQMKSSSSRRKRARTRKPSEVIALNKIATARWEKAVETGKIKRLGERHLYYDYN